MTKHRNQKGLDVPKDKGGHSKLEGERIGKLTDFSEKG